MAESIHSPWIRDYLVDAAETYGGDLASVPPRKTGKAQIIKFINHQTRVDNYASVWALISDKSHYIHVRFSEQALQDYAESQMFRGKPISEHRTALVIIKRFRPFFARVPLGEGKGMSASQHLSLNVDAFDLKGSYGEDTWGFPEDIEASDAICDWVAGLKEDGGGGNILKLRKAEPDQSETLRVKLPMIVQQKLDLRKALPKSRLETEVHTSDGHTHPSAHPIGPNMSETLLPRSWSKFWRMNRVCSILPQEATSTLCKLADKRHPRDVSIPEGSGRKSPQVPKESSADRLQFVDAVMHLVEAAQPSTLLDKRPSASPRATLETDMPSTPSQWSPSVRGSQALNLPESDNEDDASIKGAEAIDDPVCGDTIAFPEGIAEVVRDDTDKPFLEQGDASQDPFANSEVNYGIPPPATSSPRPLIQQLTTSSLQSPSNPSRSIVQEADIMQEDTALTNIPASQTVHEAHLARRVPIPRRAPHDTDSGKGVGGFGKILVPDSDTSGALSQSQPQGPQSQSLSYASQKSAPQTQELSLPHSSNDANSKTQSSHPSQQSLSYASYPRSEGADQSQLPHEADLQPQDVQLHLVQEKAASSIPLATSNHGGALENGDKNGHPTATLADTQGSQNEVMLDADDTKTKEMVDGYLSQIIEERPDMLTAPATALSQLITPNSTPLKVQYTRAGSASGGSFLESRDVGSNRPLLPSSPDVFLNEDSFHASSRRNTSPSQSSSAAPKTPSPDSRGISSNMKDVKASLAPPSSHRAAKKIPSLTPYHDPSVWVEPSFKSRISSAKISSSGIGHKRAISPSSSAPPPAKKRKLLITSELSTVSASRSHTRKSTSTTEVGNAVDDSARRKPSPDTTSSRIEALSTRPNNRARTQHVESTRSGSGSGSVARRTLKTETGAPHEARQDRRLRDTTRSGQRIASLANAETVSPPKAIDGSSKNRTSDRDVSCDPSSSRGSSSSGLVSSRARDLASICTGTKEEAFEKVTSAGVLSEPNKPDQRPWLGGYRTHAHIPASDGGPMITAEDALEMLLKAGRRRYKERREAEHSKDRGSS